MVQPVRQDWAIFKDPRLQIFFLNYPKCFVIFWAILKNHISCKTVVATFWVTLGIILATVYYNIWSHCTVQQRIIRMGGRHG